MLIDFKLIDFKLPDHSDTLRLLRNFQAYLTIFSIVTNQD